MKVARGFWRVDELRVVDRYLRSDTSKFRKKTGIKAVRIFYEID